MRKNLVKSWKHIEEFDNYEISNYGEVKNIKTGKYLRQYDSGNNYKKVYLCKDGFTKGFFVHRLVAQAFIPNPGHLPEVDHIDYIRDNNRVDNLRWISKADNLKNRSWAHPVIMRSRDGEFLMRFKYAVDAARYIQLSHPNSKLITIQMAICQVCRDYRPTAYGYKWEYETESYSKEAQNDFWEQCEELKNKKEIK